MTGIALHLCMRASQRIFRVLVVIKANGTPLTFVVAALTLSAITTGVDILNLVTADARRTDSFVALPGMAAGADCRTVRFLQRKLRRVVVERLDTAPFDLAVAFVARFPQMTLVRIFRLVTIEAASGRVAEFDRLGVATCALHGHVRVAQDEIRDPMVECFAV